MLTSKRCASLSLSLPKSYITFYKSCLLVVQINWEQDMFGKVQRVFCLHNLVKVDRIG